MLQALRILRRAFSRKVGLATGALALNLMCATSAHAQLAPIYNELMDQVQQMAMKKIMAKMGVGIEGAVTQSAEAVRGEVLKQALARKGIAEGLESYRQTIRVQNAAQDTREALQQPVTTCATVSAAGGLGNAEQSVKAGVVATQSRIVHAITGRANTVQAIEEAHQATNAQTCTPQEAARGICSVNGQHPELAGADQNAAFLFQGARDKSATYDGGHDGPQSQAAEAYIRRVVAEVPPEQLHNVNYATSPAGRGYIELVRRYAAILSMSSFSLSQVKEGHTPQTGLGTSTGMASAPGYPQKTDMSMIEAVERFIATKFSPQAMQDAATATNPNLILRDMAQMSAFQLWIDHQTLQQDTRTEALMANQLSLQTEKTLRPALDAQRAAAARAQ